MRLLTREEESVYQNLHMKSYFIKDIFVFQTSMPKMPLPLSNINYGIERNICFVNSSIQLLWSIPLIREFFQYEMYSDFSEKNHRMCTEITKLFTRKEIQSTATLRILLGSKRGLQRFLDGTQQANHLYFARILCNIKV